MAAREGVGLSDAQVERLREQVAAGATPRVRVSGPQFADQPTGTVLAVGRPETDGDEFVTVRVKAGGVTDELRFSPRELATGRGSAAKASGRPARSSGKKKTTPQKTPPPTKAPAPAKAAAPAKGAPATGAPAKAPAPAKAATPPKKSATPAEATAGPDKAAVAKAPAPAPPPPPGSAGTSRRRGASLPTVSVTLASAGATWSVSAHRGSRAVIKSAPIPPGVVSAVAELLGLPAVSDAVAAVNDAALREAEARAAALRAELAALEAELTSHRRPQAP
jgi:hypothetical protein